MHVWGLLVQAGGGAQQHRGSLFAGVLPPCLQPLASARLGSCSDGKGGGGRTWKQKGCSGLCSLTQSWHEG